MACGICAICGWFARVEAHHVAGQANCADVVVDLCVDDHNELTYRRLPAHGIQLAHDAERCPEDQLRALAVGYLEVQRLHLERHPQPPLSARLPALLARVVSRAIDSTLPPDRPGRWRPNPTVRVDSVPPTPANEDSRRRMLLLGLQLAVDVIDAVPYSPADDAAEVAALRALAADPGVVIARIESQLGYDAEALSSLSADMANAAEGVYRLLLFMAAYDPDSPWPAERVDDARRLGQTIRRLEQRLIDVVGIPRQVSS